MPHHRTRAMIVARGAQPTGPDRRLPARAPAPPVPEASAVNAETTVDPAVNAGAHVDTDVDDPGRRADPA